MGDDKDFLTSCSGGDNVMIDKKGVPKRDGSGRGVRANRGRGGCETTKEIGQGRTTPPPRRGRGWGRGRY